MVWLPSWGCDGMIGFAQKLLMARAGVPSGITWTDPDVSAPSYSTTSGFIISLLRDIAFDQDGLNMYAVDGRGDAILWYTLSTAWDISTLSSLQGTLVVKDIESVASTVWIHPLGTKVWYGGLGGDKINEASLSSAYDITTAGSPTYSTAVLGNIEAMCMDPSGTYLYAGGGAIGYQLTLSTPFDLSSYSLTHTTSGAFDSGRGTDIEGIWINQSGTKLYILDSLANEVRQYNLSTAWDLSSKSAAADVVTSITTNSTSVNGLFFNPDADKMFVSDDGGNTIDVYTI